ncbi:CDP-diacylglycerol--glycerol-3-phosphate 3-phosphatidyltransferase [Kitasatospora cheerisanensis KCTC 2395]|uniref:CDP-diacylglycerol--glycerol-3-phosphate 3-phosphatidyltransferase n=1 Tax=Kitasatospora cheerisanensis KCTC 2395 TaxID=1348663 RepID=A0A066Z8S6_9ACTN|nr:CDP-diacylglycerol--glycerol-3-phosphate 3-phosphatidyltransferase [Kitasatospora cheerisanensis KCTC 2395]
MSLVPQEAPHRGGPGDASPDRPDLHDPQSAEHGSAGGRADLSVVGVVAGLRGPKNDGWAIVVLMLSGVSDYLDGKLARRWGQISRLGQLLDPAADRLYIVSTLVGLTWREILPWWLTALLVAREAFVGVVLLRLNRAGYGPLNVSFLGKAATFNLMYAFPLLLLSVGVGWVHQVAGAVSWAFIWWGTTLYWWAGALYAVQARQMLKAERTAAV